jgi:hypothetical protein
MLKMYEDFARIPRTVAAISTMSGAPGGGGAGRAGPEDPAGRTGRPWAGLDPAVYLESYLMWQNRADAAIYLAKDTEVSTADQTTLQLLLQVRCVIDSARLYYDSELHQHAVHLADVCCCHLFTPLLPFVALFSFPLRPIFAKR